MIRITGKATLTYDQPPRILEAASIVGQKEGDGPLSHLFDCIEPDPKFGKNTWEEAESELQLRTARKVLEKSGMTEEQIRYLFAGDLLAQGIATSYGIMELQIPLFGLYGACSTCGESLGLASITVAGGAADCVMALTSSHFASAEKEFRFPLEYAGQRPLSTTWTVTGFRCLCHCHRRTSLCRSGSLLYQRYHHRKSSGLWYQRFHAHGCSHGSCRS